MHESKHMQPHISSDLVSENTKICLTGTVMPEAENMHCVCTLCDQIRIQEVEVMCQQLSGSSCMLKVVCLGASVRVHLDPSVQAAGEHHPTDLKTGSVGVKECRSVTMEGCRKLECY